MSEEPKSVLVQTATLERGAGKHGSRRRRGALAVISALLGVAYSQWDARSRIAEAEEFARLWSLSRGWLEPVPPLQPDNTQLEPQPESGPDTSELELAPFEVEGAPSGMGAWQKRLPNNAKSKSAEAPKDVRVSSETVLRLANARAMPGATGVPTDGTRPPGLRLSGVSRLGLGVRDGDVLTAVSGGPVSSLASVVSIVLRERARHAEGISGTVWRGKSAYQLWVEMPYPEAAKAAPSAVRSGS